jgi:hypothetical protein
LALALAAAAVTLAVVELLSLAALGLTTPGYGRVTQQRRAQLTGSGQGGLILAGRQKAFEYLLFPYYGFGFDPQATPLVNRHGFVGPSLLDDSRPDEYNVVISGGSVATSFYVFCQDKLAKALAGLPALGGRKPRIYCLAVAGFKQPQQLMALTYFLSRGARVDLMLEIDGFNEVFLPARENSREGLAPFYPALWSQLTQDFHDKTARRWLGRMTFLDDARDKLTEVADLPPWRYSPLANLLWWHLDRYLALKAADMAENMRTAKDRFSFEQTGRMPGQAAPDESQVIERAADNWLVCAEMMSREVQAHGGLDLQVLQPNQYVAGSKPLSQAERAKAISQDPAYGETVRRGYAALLARTEKLAAQGVPFLNATRVFAQSAEDLYMDTCCHFSPQGHDILLAAVVQALRPTLTASVSGE